MTVMYVEGVGIQVGLWHDGVGRITWDRVRLRHCGERRHHIRGRGRVRAGGRGGCPGLLGAAALFLLLFLLVAQLVFPLLWTETIIGVLFLMLELLLLSHLFVVASDALLFVLPHLRDQPGDFGLGDALVGLMAHALKLIRTI